MTVAGFLLQGKIALITGAGRGLGLEIAKGLAQAGAHVIINGRSRAPLEQAVAMITATSGSAALQQFDIADDAAVTEAFTNIHKEHGRLDILVNNVGMRDRRGLFEFEMDAVRRLINVDLVAPFHVCREAARLM